MRLALRALFGAADSDEEGAARRALLERKLRENERSAEFFRRLRAAVADVSLKAPEVFAEESFPDANVVAEYLDGQASPELAREYEDACWDLPEMLAEVGRCYDALNGALDVEPVVSKNCRRRLYYLAWEDVVEAASAEKTATTNDSLDEKQNETNVLAVSVEKKEKKREKIVPPSKSEREARRRQKTEKTAKTEKTVRSALAAERSLGRRVRRFGARFAVAAGLLGVGYCGWRTFDDPERSETFPIQAAVERAPVPSESAVDELRPLRPTTISSATAEELSSISPDEAARLTQNDPIFVANAANEAGEEPPKLASLPITEEIGERNGGKANLTRFSDGTRSGLGGEPWERRPTLEIPAQNNDVFSKPRIY